MNADMQEKVYKALEDSGFISEMKLLLRNEVYASIKTLQKEPITEITEKPAELDTELGVYAWALVYDFMNQFGMRFSLKMSQFEGCLDNPSDALRDLEESFRKRSQKNNPLLMEIVAQTFVQQDEEIQSDIDSNSESLMSTDRKDDLVESAGTSQGYDQSVNSLAMDEFDYIEVVKKNL